MKSSEIWPGSRTAKTLSGEPISPAIVPEQSDPTIDHITGTVRSIEPGKIEGVYQFRLWDDPLDRLLKTDNAECVILLNGTEPVTVTIQLIGRGRDSWKVVGVVLANRTEPCPRCNETIDPCRCNRPYPPRPVKPSVVTDSLEGGCRANGPGLEARDSNLGGSTSTWFHP